MTEGDKHPADLSGLSDDEFYRAMVRDSRAGTAEGLDSDSLQHTLARTRQAIASPSASSWPTWLWRGASGAGLLLAAGVVLLLMRPPNGDTPRPQVAVLRASGTVQFLGEEGEILAADTTQAIESIVLGTGAKVDVRLDYLSGASAQLALRDRSRLDVGSSALVLQSGRGYLSVISAGGIGPVMRLGEVNVVVVGARFGVSVSDGGTLQSLVVAEGRVEIDGGSLGRSIDEGDSFGPRPAAHADTVELVRGLRHWSTDLPHRSSAASGFLQLTSSPSGARVWVDGEGFGSTPLFARLPATAHMVVVQHSGFRPYRKEIIIPSAIVRDVSVALSPAGTLQVETSDRLRRAREALRKQACDRLNDVLGPLLRKKPDPSSVATERALSRLLVAECQLRRGQSNNALAAFRDLAENFPDTRAGEQATFEMGKILADNGRAASSRRAMRTYLRRYPQGIFADSAGYRICEALIAESAVKKAARCLRRYREERPQGLWSDPALFALAQLEFDRQAFRRSAELWQAVLGSESSGRLQRSNLEVAHYRLIQSYRHLGDRDGFIEQLARYRRAFPRGKYLKQLAKDQP